MRHYHSHCSQSLVCELSVTHTHTNAREDKPASARARRCTCTLETLQASQSKASCEAGLLPLLDSAELTGLQAGPCVSQHCPLPRSLFLGMAALSSWLSWSSLCADFKPLAVSSCQEFIILNTGPLFSTVNKGKEDYL